MIGQAIGAQPLSGPGLRVAASEQAGPRPGGTAGGIAEAEQRQVRAVADGPGRALRP
jgi:hypothetical protein